MEQKQQRQCNIWIPKCPIDPATPKPLLDHKRSTSINKTYRKTIPTNIIMKTNISFNGTLYTPRTKRLLKGILLYTLLGLKYSNEDEGSQTKASRSFDFVTSYGTNRIQELNQLALIPQCNKGRNGFKGSIMRMLQLRNRARSSTLDKMTGYVNFRFGCTIRQNSWCRSSRAMHKGKNFLVINKEGSKVTERQFNNWLSPLRKITLKSYNVQINKVT